MESLPIEERQSEKKGPRLLRAVSLIAAFLVICALVVTSALLLSRHSTANKTQPTALPISITLSSCASQPRPVLVNLCAHHQLTNLLQSGKMDKYVIGLERAYLDMNQLLITYRVFSQSTGQQTPANLSDTLVTTSQGFTFSQSAGETPATGPAVVQFSTPSLPANIRALQFQVEVKALIFPVQKLPPPGTPLPQQLVVHGSSTFKFTLPYHGGLIVTPHQTITMNATSLTLQQVLISPTETLIEGTTKGPLQSTPDYTMSLDAAGQNPRPDGTALGGDSNPFSAVFYDGLLGQHGKWTFEISYASGQESLWLFHFMVP